MLPDEDPRKAHINEELITYVEDRKGHDRRYAIAPDKIKAEIGWYPETMFAEGIKKTIKWYFEHEDWMANVTSGDYQKYYDGCVNAKLVDLNRFVEEGHPDRAARHLHAALCFNKSLDAAAAAGDLCNVVALEPPLLSVGRVHKR